MKQRILSKGLAVAVILLFLGLAIQPSVAVSPNSTESEDDCECQEVNTVESNHLINRIRVYVNIILSKFGHIPEIVNICDEILDVLDTGIKDTICELLLNSLWEVITILEYLMWRAKTFMGTVYMYAAILTLFIVVFIWDVFCENSEPPWKLPSSIILDSTLNQI